MKSRDSYNKKYKHILAVLMTIIMMVTLTGFGYEEGAIIDEMKHLLRNYYVSDLPEQVFNKDSVSDMMKEINKTDPYTKYYSSRQYNEFISTVNYHSSLIGIYIVMTADGAKVETVNKNSPEEKAGLQIDDIIVVANNHILIGVKQELAIKYILGEQGKKVELKVKRENHLITIKIDRVEKKNATVEGQVLDKHIGYIKIHSFGEDTSYLFGSKVSQFQRMNVDSYIIDLRFNNGGIFTAALDVAGYFIGNSTALITKGRVSENKKFNGTFQGKLINRPIIFLINGYSASAAEILAAAVKDYKKAYFIGSTTYGKGSVQWAARLSNNDVLKLTISKFYSPKGKQIDRVGIKPDLFIPDNVSSLWIAQMLLNTNNYVKDTRGYSKVVFNNKMVVVDNKRVITPIFWKAYKYLLELAYKNGSVMVGNGLGWTAVKKSSIKDYAEMFYPGYKKTVRLNGVQVDSQFTLKFSSEIEDSYLLSTSVELIELNSGRRAPITFKVKDKNTMIIIPKDDLHYKTVYYLVVHPNTLKANSNSTVTGLINEIHTVSQ